jgi:hypothetical protein
VEIGSVNIWHSFTFGSCSFWLSSKQQGQVSEELRPTLPPDRRSRVPTAVRQVLALMIVVLAVSILHSILLL